MKRPVPKLNDLSRCLVPFDQNSTLIAVIEMSLSSWLVAGIVPGLERHPSKKLGVDEQALCLLQRWRGGDQGWAHDHTSSRPASMAIVMRFLAGALVAGPRHQRSACPAPLTAHLV
jgi:transposase